MQADRRDKPQSRFGDVIRLPRARPFHSRDCSAVCTGGRLQAGLRSLDSEPLAPHFVEASRGSTGSTFSLLVALVRGRSQEAVALQVGAYDDQPSLTLRRYEREYGQAQRALIRRMREHDTSPAVPMVVSVCRIKRFTAPLEAVKDGERSVIVLEVTDGWYRIDAQIDATLKRAVESGKIGVGRKLAVCGAKVSNLIGYQSADFDSCLAGPKVKIHWKGQIKPFSCSMGIAARWLDGTYDWDNKLDRFCPACVA